MQTIKHPHSGQTIVGVRLLPGTTLKKGDKYDGARGVWDELGQDNGLIIAPGCTTVWVRQPGPFSDNARNLLRFLNRHLNGWDTIARRRGVFYVVPKPEFNWDGRIDIESTKVLFPECVDELVDHGYLAPSVAIVANWHPDYSECEPAGLNQVWTLTDEGREQGKKLRAA
jgi:hypothetical protein